MATEALLDIGKFNNCFTIKALYINFGGALLNWNKKMNLQGTFVDLDILFSADIDTGY